MVGGIGQEVVAALLVVAPQVLGDGNVGRTKADFELVAVTVQVTERVRRRLRVAPREDRLADATPGHAIQVDVDANEANERIGHLLLPVAAPRQV